MKVASNTNTGSQEERLGSFLLASTNDCISWTSSDHDPNGRSRMRIIVRRQASGFGIYSIPNLEVSSVVILAQRHDKPPRFFSRGRSRAPHSNSPRSDRIYLDHPPCLTEFLQPTGPSLGVDHDHDCPENGKRFRSQGRAQGSVNVTPPNYQGAPVSLPKVNADTLLSHWHTNGSSCHSTQAILSLLNPKVVYHLELLFQFSFSPLSPHQRPYRRS